LRRGEAVLYLSREGRTVNHACLSEDPRQILQGKRGLAQRGGAGKRPTVREKVTLLNPFDAKGKRWTTWEKKGRGQQKVEGSKQGGRTVNSWEGADSLFAKPLMQAVLEGLAIGKGRETIRIKDFPQ